MDLLKGGRQSLKSSGACVFLKISRRYQGMSLSLRCATRSRCGQGFLWVTNPKVKPMLTPNLTSKTMQEPHQKQKPRGGD